MMRLARCGSFHRLESSACRFSSASRPRALSTSKMPPQQPDRLLDLGNDGLDFGAHGGNRGSAIRRQKGISFFVFDKSTETSRRSLIADFLIP